MSSLSRFRQEFTDSIRKQKIQAMLTEHRKRIIEDHAPAVSRTQFEDFVKKMCTEDLTALSRTELCEAIKQLHLTFSGLRISAPDRFTSIYEDTAKEYPLLQTLIWLLHLALDSLSTNSDMNFVNHLLSCCISMTYSCNSSFSRVAIEEPNFIKKLLALWNYKETTFFSMALLQNLIIDKGHWPELIVKGGFFFSLAHLLSRTDYPAIMQYCPSLKIIISNLPKSETLSKPVAQILKIFSERFMERATETDAEQLLMCLCAFIDVSNEGCCEIINTPPLWKVIEEFANSFDSRRVFVAYCFLGNLTFKLTDMMPIAKILKGSVIRFQLGSVDANACNKIIWTLSNILADDTFGRLLFEDICNTKMFIETLLEALHLHIKAGKPMNGDILVCLVHLGDGHFLELLLNKYKVLTIVEILLERTNSKSSLESGLTILWALLEKGAIEFCPKVNSENPTVVVLTKEDDLCNLLTSLFKTPFKSVHTLLQKIYEDYLPYDC